MNLELMLTSQRIRSISHILHIFDRKQATGYGIPQNRRIFCHFKFGYFILFIKFYGWITANNKRCRLIDSLVTWSCLLSCRGFMASNDRLAVCYELERIQQKAFVATLRCSAFVWKDGRDSIYLSRDGLSSDLKVASTCAIIYGAAQFWNSTINGKLWNKFSVLLAK